MGINHVTLLVKNKQESEAFYNQVLEFEKRNIGSSLWIKIGNQYLHISEDKIIPTASSFKHIAIEVEDLKQFGKSLLAKNVEVFYYDDDNQLEIKVDELNTERSQLFVRDPDGNLLEFIDQSNKFFHPE